VQPEPHTESIRNKTKRNKSNKKKQTLLKQQGGKKNS